ncbi:MAG: hypothetical protein IE931_03355 [Sphingobacteriales bacterium]|nr:hypothetical protein [Sphingobacteriales bacterium]
MSFEGVKINQLNGGLGGENDSTDNIVALICAVDLADLPGTVAHHVPYLCLQTADAEALGVDASFDANKKFLIHNAIEQFFLYAPEAKIYLIFAPVATAVVIAGTDGVKGALRQASEVKGFGFVNIADELADVVGEVEGLQAIVDGFKAEHRLFDFVIVPAMGDAVEVALADYPDLRAKAAANISVCIAQDPTVAATLPEYAKYADVGAALGMLAIRGVNENLGSVDINKKPSAKRGDKDYPLTDEASNRWLSATLSDGKKVSDLSAVEKKSLTTKGYIYAGSYDGYAGVFFNSSPTSVEKVSDYAYIERNRTWNKAARAIRNVLIPEVKRTVKKDETTGYIRSTTITRWTGIVKKVLEVMEAADEISGSSVYINPKQILSETSPLNIKVKVISDGIVYEFEIDLGLSTKL